MTLLSVIFSFMLTCNCTSCDHCFIITGGPGSGKTTLIEELRKRGIFCVDEVARKIIQEEMALGGNAVPDDGIVRRIEMMLIRSIETYEMAAKQQASVKIFDRGVLDYLGYAYRTHTPIADELLQAARSLAYNKKVFIAPPWEEIYCNDTERTQSFQEAVEVYEELLKLYTEQGYQIIELPKADVKARADFIINHVEALS